MMLFCSSNHKSKALDDKRNGKRCRRAYGVYVNLPTFGVMPSSATHLTLKLLWSSFKAHGVLFLLHGYISLASIQHHLMLMCCHFLRNYYFNHVGSYLLHTQYFSAQMVLLSVSVGKSHAWIGGNNGIQRWTWNEKDVTCKSTYLSYMSEKHLRVNLLQYDMMCGANQEVSIVWICYSCPRICRTGWRRKQQNFIIFMNNIRLHGIKLVKHVEYVLFMYGVRATEIICV